MGKGKGANEGYVAVIKPGRVMFELEGVTEELARAAFLSAHHKLPLKTQLISREPVL
jgi:large subunit ribosomal protein L16